MTIAPGEFWIADIPFTDTSSSKKRPVLVLWLDGSDAVVSAVTTADVRSPMDVALSDWKASGLRKASTGSLVPINLPRADFADPSNWIDITNGCGVRKARLDEFHSTAVLIFAREFAQC